MGRNGATNTTLDMATCSDPFKIDAEAQQTATTAKEHNDVLKGCEWRIKLTWKNDLVR
jgi:hypothetical protein